MITYKGRRLNKNKPVQVYRNLTKKCYSIRQFGQVVAHSNSLCLANAKFIVNEVGRDRVRKTGRKQVHAVVEGYIKNSGCGVTEKDELQCEIRYNPVYNDYFTCYNLTIEPVKVTSALFVICGTDKVTAAYIN